MQRENISYFVRACQMLPLDLPDHDIFLTDDLYEAKDPAQVLQCIVAFSRRANAVNPSAFPRAMGAKSKVNLVSPQSSGRSQGGYTRSPTGPQSRERGLSNASDSGVAVWNPLAKGSYSGRISPSKGSTPVSPPPNVSSWSTRGDEGRTAPAWNIHQYGFMGGANQGNQHVSFMSRRQITSPDPSLPPSLAEKERRRKEVEKEVERQRVLAKNAEQNKRQELEAKDERDRLLEEEERWRDETRRLREVEQEEVEAEKRRWDEEQRRWKEGEEEGRLREERPLGGQQSHERNQRPDIRLRGQFLSQYQAEQDRTSSKGPNEASGSASEIQRSEDFGRLFEPVKEPERQPYLGRQERLKNDRNLGGYVSGEQGGDESPESGRPQVLPKTSHVDDWQESERDYLRKEWQTHNDTKMQQQRPPPPHTAKPILSETASMTEVKVERDRSRPLPSPRPLPNPSAHAPNLNRTNSYLSATPAAAPVHPDSHRPADYPTTIDVEWENQGRQDSQARTRAGGRGPKSLLEKEMEDERRRQREWEKAQKETAKAPRNKLEGIGPGQSWDVHQYGYLGGDSQNKVGPGLGIGGARRQIIGPRPPP